MRKKLTNNLVYKIMSIVFAIIVWLVVVNIEDPTTTRIITGINITYLNDVEITSKDLFYTVTTGKTAYVKIRGPRSIVDELDASDFVATADFMEMSMTNAIPVNVELSDENMKNANKIEIVEKSSPILIALESIQEKSLDVEVAYTGTPAAGYVVGTQEISMESIDISAPKSTLKTIKSVVLSVDTTGKADDFSVNVVPTLLDTDGNVINIEYPVTVNNSLISVKVTMYKIKEVNLNFSTTGEVPEGYEFIELTYNPNAVTIKGREEDLENINSITFPSSLINITGATQNIVVNDIDISDYLPEGIRLYDEISKIISVTAKIQGPEQKEFTIVGSRVELRNVPTDYVGSIITNPLYVMLSGNATDLNAVDINKLVSYVDLTGAIEGNNERILMLNLPSGINLVSEIKVTVLLTKKSITGDMGDNN